MPVGIEVFNTTVDDISKDLVLAGEKSIPLFDALRRKNNINKQSIGGTYFEHLFVGGAPGSATAIYTGTEVAAGTRTPITYKLMVESHRFIAPIFIPKVELEKNEGKNGIIKLVDAYPKATMMSLYRDVNKWILAANPAITGLKLFGAADLDGLATLNSQYVGTKRLGVTTGLLSFAAPAAQVAVTQNQAKGAAIEYYNQYADTPSFAASGIDRLTTAYMNAAEFSSDRSGPDLGVFDPDSYANLLTYTADTVRIESTDKGVFGKKVGVTVFFNALVYRDTDLDRTTFTGDAADGVGYLLTTDDIELDYYKMPSIGKFAEWTPMQDVVAAQCDASFNLLMKRMNSQATVTGLATP